MKTSELTGAALNWAVAKIIGLDIELMYGVVHVDGEPFMPDLDWNAAGPIIERELIEIYPLCNVEWGARKVDSEGDLMRFYGDTPLIAAMRCYVASKLGDDIEIPEELTQGESK
jgi:hypothetical protein